MDRKRSKNTQNIIAQTAVEYLLLLGAVTAVVLVGFNVYFAKVSGQSETFFNQAARGIYGINAAYKSRAQYNNYP